jgi:hypothetical protein
VAGHVLPWVCLLRDGRELRVGKLGDPALAARILPLIWVCPAPRLHARSCSADEVGSHCLEQQRACLGPLSGRSGRNDDAGAGLPLDQAGDLVVVVPADPDDIAVDEA